MVISGDLPTQALRKRSSNLATPLPKALPGKHPSHPCGKPGGLLHPPAQLATSVLIMGAWAVLVPLACTGLPGHLSPLGDQGLLGGQRPCLIQPVFLPVHWAPQVP